MLGTCPFGAKKLNRRAIHVTFYGGRVEEIPDAGNQNKQKTPQRLICVRSGGNILLIRLRSG